jgi:NAD(P)-dependent dehydrogenase (short-subunit alcohol dehydrogenase family)
MSSEEKLALVTGTTMPHGVGKAAALAIAADGADLVVTCFSHMEGVEAIAEGIKAMGRKSMAIRMNGRDYADVQKGLQTIKPRWDLSIFS